MNDQHTQRGERAITVWLHAELVAELDNYLAAKVAHVPGARVSRHGWIAQTVIAGLASAKSSAPTSNSPQEEGTVP